MLDPSEWTIYRWRNLRNGKEYYGQDKTGLRIQAHLDCINSGCTVQCNGTSKLHKAVRSYGLDSFSIEIQEIGFSSQEEINRIEDDYIIGNDSLVPNGYNSRTNEHSQGGKGTGPKDKYEKILDYLPPELEGDLPPEFSDSFQPIQIRSIEREIPEWTASNAEIQRVILTAFPNLKTRKNTRKRAGRWARIIYLYYRVVLPRQIVAKEIGMSRDSLNRTLQSINWVQAGLRSDGKPRKSATPPPTYEGRGERGDETK